MHRFFIVCMFFIIFFSCVSTKFNSSPEIENSNNLIIFSLRANGTFQKNELIYPTFINIETQKEYKFIKPSVTSVFIYAINLPNGTYAIKQGTGPKTTFFFTGDELGFTIQKGTSVFLGSYEIQVSGSFKQDFEFVRLGDEIEEVEFHTICSKVDKQIERRKRK